VIPFFAKTWFLWWMFAVVVILRWFHRLSPETDATLKASRSEENESTVPSRQIPSPQVSRSMAADGTWF
jgi:hypothetical protein